MIKFSLRQVEFKYDILGEISQVKTYWNGHTNSVGPIDTILPNGSRFRFEIRNDGTPYISLTSQQGGEWLFSGYALIESVRKERIDVEKQYFVTVSHYRDGTLASETLTTRKHWILSNRRGIILELDLRP